MRAGEDRLLAICKRHASEDALSAQAIKTGARGARKNLLADWQNLHAAARCDQR
jgi:hypothetical protein